MIVSRDKSNPNFIISDMSEESLYRGKLTKSVGMVVIGGACIVGTLALLIL